MGKVRYELEASPAGKITLNLDISEEEYQKYKRLSKEEKVNYIVENGVKNSTIDLMDIEYVMAKRVKK